MEPAGRGGCHTRPRNCAVTPGGSSGPPPMSDVDRGFWTEQPRQEGALEFVQVSGFALGPGGGGGEWGGALEPLRGPPSPGKALLNWTPESHCTLTPTPHLGRALRGQAWPSPPHLSPSLLGVHGGVFWGNCSPDQHSCWPPRAWERVRARLFQREAQGKAWGDPREAEQASGGAEGGGAAGQRGAGCRPG